MNTTYDLIKKCIISDLGEKIDQIIADKSKTKFLTRRNLYEMLLLMWRKKRCYLSLIEYIYIKSDYCNYINKNEADKTRARIFVGIQWMMRVACYKDDIIVLKFILSDEMMKIFPEIDPSYNVNILLIQASSGNSINIVRYLLSDEIRKLFPKIDPTDRNNIIIKQACRYNSLAVVKYLLSDEIIPRVDPSICRNDPIITACAHGHIDIVKYLLSDEIIKLHPNIDPSADNNDGIIQACRRGHIEVVKYLLSPKIRKMFPKIDPNSKNNLGLIYACDNNQTDIVKYILSEYVLACYPSTYACISAGIIIYLISANLVQILEYLAPKIFKSYYYHHDYDTYLQHAIRRRNVEIVKLLLDNENVTKKIGIDLAISINTNTNINININIDAIDESDPSKKISDLLISAKNKISGKNI